MRGAASAMVVFALVLSDETPRGLALGTDDPQGGDVVATRTVVDFGPDSARPVVLRIDPKDSLTPPQLAQLRSGSALARELLLRVANLPDTILMLTAHRTLFEQTRLYGRSRFWVSHGELFGRLEYQASPLNSWGTQCLIVHELAHAVEIATADRAAGTEALRAFVLSRALWLDPPNRGAETEFPEQVVRAVLGELRGKTDRQRTLEQIAAAHHVTLPPAAPTDGVLTSAR